jgi:hypothetical protein
MMNFTTFPHPETSDSPMAQPIPVLVLDIIREGKEDVSWLNRYCQNPTTKVSLRLSPLPQINQITASDF